MRGGGLLGVPVGGGFLGLLLVAPRVFRAPEGPAAREARRPHFVRRCASKPALALPPPTSTAARPRLEARPCPPVPPAPSTPVVMGVWQH